MSTYEELEKAMTLLEHQLQGNSTWPPDRVPDSIREWVQPEHGNVQYFSVDTTTRDDLRPLPAIVSVGANYSQGPNQLADGVKANLGQWRSGLEAVLRAYQLGRYKQWWRPSERRRVPLKMFSDLAIEIPKDYHYVQTNFSPWITRDQWSDLRGTEAARNIVLHPPGDIPWSEYLAKLRDLLPTDTLWTGHGNWDIHQLFMEFVELFKVDRWLFSPNLSPNTIFAWLSKHDP